MKRGVAIALLVFATTLVTGARADNIWQRAQKPSKWQAAGALSDDALHRLVATKLAQAQRETPFTAEWISQLDGARNALIAHHAAERTDPRLHYDLGLVFGELRRCDDAVGYLEAALRMAPDHPFAAKAAFELALCYARTGKHPDEERAYLFALDATDSASFKALVYSNLSESRMAQGKLEAAIDAAEASIALEPDAPSPRYNLAILRDRSGDAFGAIESAGHAVEYDPDGEYLDGEGVFFSPAYERHWYHALRDLALAEREKGDVRVGFLMAALVHYRQWLEQSEPADRYRARCEDNIARLEKQLKLKKK